MTDEEGPVGKSPHVYSGIQEFFEELDRQSRFPRPLWWRITFLNLVLKPRDLYRKVKAALQRRRGRLKHGISRPDTWSMDVYVAGVVSHGVRTITEHGVTHHPDFEPDEWKAYLLNIADDLEGYRGDPFDDPAAATRAKAALRRYAEYFEWIYD